MSNETESVSNIPQADTANAYLHLLSQIEEIQRELDGKLVKSSTVKTSYGGYSYMKLDDLDPLVRELCRARGLRLYYPAKEGHQGAGIIDLTTGAKEESYLPLTATPRDMQDLGKFITYVKRYALFNVIGVGGAMDNDAVEGQGRKSPNQKKRTGASTKSTGLDLTGLI